MASIPNDVFLMSCINNSEKGKVDWGKVAKQCNIITANAANCRFRYLRDKLDLSVLSTDQGNAKDTPSPAKTPKRKRKATPTVKRGDTSNVSESDEKDSEPPAKKRKDTQTNRPAFSHIEVKNEDTENYHLFSS